MPGEPTDPQMLAFARDVERATRRIGHLERLVRVLAEDVAALPRTVSNPSDEADDDPAGQVRAWLLTDDATEARTDLADLVDWLTRVFLRYRGAGLPSCWLWHPWAVEELRWLREAHRQAYSGDLASWAKAGDWHDRQRPGVVKRLREGLGGCELALHAPGAEQARPPAAPPLHSHATQIAEHWITTGTAPEPTPDQIAQAQQHDHDEHRTTHR